MSSGPLKENSNSISPSKEMRKLRIQLTDRNFELKKMEEDYAEYKAHLLMQHNAERNCLSKNIRELKDKMAEDNEYWSLKID